MTSERIPAYGGISIPSETLQALAEQMNARPVPVHLDHDLSKPVRFRGTRVFVAARPDGIDELRFAAEIHEEDLPLFEERKAMSATLRTPIERDAESVVREGAALEISGDHAWFDDAALIDAELQFLNLGVSRDVIRVQRAYQFGLLPEPQIFLDIIYPLLVSVGSASVWDGIKSTFKRRKTPRGGSAETPTVINLEILDGNRSLRAVVTTHDEAVIQLSRCTLGHQ